MKKPLKNLALLLASLLVSLLLAEAIVRFSATVRNVGPSFTVYDPVYGRTHKKNFTCLRYAPEFTMQFTTNSLGFRGPEPARFPYHGILFIGDSYTQGYGVNDGEEFPEVVRRELVRRYGDLAIPIVNAGIGNTGQGRWIKFLQSEARRFEPKIVFVEVMGNDFIDNRIEEMFVLGENGTLLEYSPAPPGKILFVQKVIESVPGLDYSHLIGLLRQTRGEGDPSQGDAVLRNKADTERLEDVALAKDDQITLRMVDEILRICRHQGWRTFLISVMITGRRLEDIRAVAVRHNVPLIRTPDINDRPDLFYKIDGHWNAKGHEFVAKQVLDALTISRVLD